jgi:hypothetical protein
MPPTPLGNRDLIRSINRFVVLNAIKAHAPIARAQLARRTGLSPATITAIAAELIEDDLVFEKEIGDSRGVRPISWIGWKPRPIRTATCPSRSLSICCRRRITQSGWAAGSRSPNLCSGRMPCT